MRKLTVMEKEHIRDSIYRCNHLADVINNTTEPLSFFQAIDELCSTLLHLCAYEKYKIFTSKPSKDYRNIKDHMVQTELKFFERLRDESPSPCDFFQKIDPYYKNFSPVVQVKIRKLHEYYFPTIFIVQKSNSLFNRFMDTLKLEKNNVQQDIYISSISNLPRYYNIRGKQYDIDSIKSINSLPTDIYSTLIYENTEYGIDTILRIHADACYEKGLESLCRACVEKSNLFYNQGIHFETKVEQLARFSLESKDREALLLHEEQIRRTTIDTMLHFQNNFKYQLNCSIIKRYNMAFVLLNKNNQFVALTDISTINELVKQSTALSAYIPENIGLCTEDIGFTYKKSKDGVSYLDEPPYTYLEYIPFTRTYKYRKYPIKLHFSYDNNNYYTDSFNDSAWGELEYFQDGTIGKGTLTRWLDSYLYIYHFRTLGRSLVISKIESTVTCQPSGLYETIYKYN